MWFVVALIGLAYYGIRDLHRAVEDAGEFDGGFLQDEGAV